MIRVFHDILFFCVLNLQTEISKNGNTQNFANSCWQNKRFCNQPFAKHPLPTVILGVATGSIIFKKNSPRSSLLPGVSNYIRSFDFVLRTSLRMTETIFLPSTVYFLLRLALIP